MTGVLESQAITPACRSSRTDDGAWNEAVRRLREIYDAQVEHNPAAVLSLAIFRGEFDDILKRHKEAEAAASHTFAVLQRAVPDEEAQLALWRAHWRDQLKARAALARPTDEATP